MILTAVQSVSRLLQTLSICCALCGSLGAATPIFSESALFTSGQGGYNTYRIPAIVRTTSGTLLAFCEGRKTSSSDGGDIDIVLRRSTDHGTTWEPLQLVTEEGDSAAIAIGNPVPVVDETTGRVFLIFCRNNSRVFYTSSSDDGLSWSPTPISPPSGPIQWLLRNPHFPALRSDPMAPSGASRRKQPPSSDVF